MHTAAHAQLKLFVDVMSSALHYYLLHTNCRSCTVEVAVKEWQHFGTDARIIYATAAMVFIKYFLAIVYDVTIQT